MRAPLSLLVLAVLSAPAAAVEIDGRIDAIEWQGARHVTDFRKVQPLSREPGTLTTQAWVMATPDGLAVVYRDNDFGYWSQSIEGGEAKRLENLPKEKLFTHAFSKDGKQFAFVRGQEIRDVVLISNSKSN